VVARWAAATVGTGAGDVNPESVIGEQVSDEYGFSLAADASAPW
jgi:hypothetical protein